MSNAETVAEDRPVSSSLWKLLFKILVSVGLLALLLSKSDPGAIWQHFREASPLWILVALLIYLLMILASVWRWEQLLGAQDVHVPVRDLVRSYLVATFMNNFLPSNIGGDVVRIRDTVSPTGSKTLATTIVLLDRAIGLLGLLFVAAIGATWVRRSDGRFPVWPPLLWAVCVAGIVSIAALVMVPTQLIGLLTPLKRIHDEWEHWIELRLQRLVTMFESFRRRPGALVNCFAGALVVQAMLVAFYLAVAASLRIAVPAVHMAVLVPLSFVVQMLPISMNGFGVREATFSYYFRLLGLPLESAILLSLMATATIMLFSLSGAAAYVSRR